MRRKKVVILAAGLLTLLPVLWACSSGRQIVFFNPQLSLDPPGPEVGVGQRVKISVTGQNFPSGIIYDWRASAGACDPPKSSQKYTVYEAPASIGDEQEKQVLVQVTFLRDGQPYGAEVSLPLTIRRDAGTAASPPTVAATSQPPATPRPTPAVGRAGIEITQPGVFDPRGARLADDSIEGKVTGVTRDEYRVILYTLSAGTWFIQPYAAGDARFTEIDSHLNFSNNYHTGVKYAALLCKRSYEDPPVQTLTLPLSNENVIAFSIVDGIKE
jgi:hypothetical protein